MKKNYQQIIEETNSINSINEETENNKNPKAVKLNI